MKKKIIAIASLLIILSFIGYIIYDTAVAKKESAESEPAPAPQSYPEKWQVLKAFQVEDGKLTSVAVSAKGEVVLGGESFVSLYDSLLTRKWKSAMNGRISAVAVFGDTIYACSATEVYLLNTEGKQLATWGPYEASSIITSISASSRYIAVADAGNKIVYIIKKDGEVSTMIGQGERKFIVPSPYFDLVLSGNDTLFIANTGNHRIEKWTTGGQFISEFGKPGVAPEEFNACCNPSHFALIPQGFVTAEKGLNRIKILDTSGNFTEFVSVNNNFVKPHPLDVASFRGRIIYAANDVDSKLYIFVRK
jgi:hypothetical protein